MRPRKRLLIRGWVTPNSFAARACVSRRASITLRTSIIRSERMRRCPASAGPNPRSVKMFPDDCCTLSFIAAPRCLDSRLDVDRLAKRRRTDWLLQASLRHNVHPAPEQSLQPEFEPGEIEERATRIERDKEVDVTSLGLGSASHRAKEPYLPRTTFGRSLQNLFAISLQNITELHTLKIERTAAAIQRSTRLPTLRALSG